MLFSLINLFKIIFHAVALLSAAFLQRWGCHKMAPISVIYFRFSKLNSLAEIYNIGPDQDFKTPGACIIKLFTTVITSIVQ